MERFIPIIKIYMVDDIERAMRCYDVITKLYAEYPNTKDSTVIGLIKQPKHILGIQKPNKYLVQLACTVNRYLLKYLIDTHNCIDVIWNEFTYKERCDLLDFDFNIRDIKYKLEDVPKVDKETFRGIFRNMLKFSKSPHYDACYSNTSDFNSIVNELYDAFYNNRTFNHLELHSTSLHDWLKSSIVDKDDIKSKCVYAFMCKHLIRTMGLDVFADHSGITRLNENVNGTSMAEIIIDAVKDATKKSDDLDLSHDCMSKRFIERLSGNLGIEHNYETRVFYNMLCVLTFDNFRDGNGNDLLSTADSGVHLPEIRSLIEKSNVRTRVSRLLYNVINDLMYKKFIHLDFLNIDLIHLTKDDNIMLLKAELQRIRIDIENK